MYLFQSSADHRDLHSFPTRRSSDLGCGLRRAELVGLGLGDFQVREEHWVIADLIGKGKHIRTVPVPAWAKRIEMSGPMQLDRKSTRLNSSHEWISYAVFCLKKKNMT